MPRPTPTAGSTYRCSSTIWSSRCLPIPCSDLKEYGAYGYGTWRFEDAGLFSGSEVTLGLSLNSYDDGKQPGRDSVELSPKIGVRIRVGPATLRGAYTEAVAPPLTLEQSLEPATVAGLGYVWHAFTSGAGSLNPRSGRDAFPIANVTLGYRLPDERGLVSVEIQNAFDEPLRFEDRYVRSLYSPTAEPRFARSFSVMGRVQLQFQRLPGAPAVPRHRACHRRCRPC